MRLTFKLSLLLLVASCFTPGQDRREKLFIESVVSHLRGGRCVKWSHGPLYCWGKYAGLPTAEFSSDPYPHSPKPVTLQGFNTADIVQMAATEQTLCARLTHGGLQCWGGGIVPGGKEFYELGRGFLASPLYTPIPKPVVGLGGVGTTLNEVSSIAAGNGTFCAVFGNQGEVACWGNSGEQYRLGVDPIQPVGGRLMTMSGSPAIVNGGSPTPLAVEAPDRPTGGSRKKLRGAARLISAWVVLMRDGTLVTWSHGFTSPGSYLGRDNTDIPPTVAPGRVKTPGGDGFLSDVRTASASPRHTCAALGKAAVVYCWGENTEGEVGSGNHVRASLPVKVVPPAGSGSLGRVLGIITPEDRTCVINAQLEVFCWGSNTSPDDIYQLGHVGGILRPTRVFPNALVIDLYGAGHSLCLNYVGNLKCVGSNMPLRADASNNLGIGIAGALTKAKLGFGNGDEIYGNDPTETLANATCARTLALTLVKKKWFFVVFQQFTGSVFAPKGWWHLSRLKNGGMWVCAFSFTWLYTSHKALFEGIRWNSKAFEPPNIKP